jgi:glycosyltransferase involved in cell wall biosynthesis
MTRRIAFFAPLKSPDDPVPSGDRAMARNLIRALEATGATVSLASDLRLYEGRGERAAQDRLIEAARTESARVTAALQGDPPDIWVSYHNYYKSPDLIGPDVSRHLGIPYVQIETSRARSRLSGPWAEFAARAEAAANAADLVFYLTEQDREALERDRPEGQALLHLPPFLPRDDLPLAARPGESRSILAVGMMRNRAKRHSYHLIARSLALLTDLDWRLEIAGDGPARGEVEAMIAPIAARTRFLGQLDPLELQAAYARAGLFFWPGVDEAYGMVYLEAQAAGLAVVAQDRPGLRDVLAGAGYPDPDLGPQALAEALRDLLEHPDVRAERGAQARQHVAQYHLLGAATARLADGLARLETVTP